MLTTLMLVLIAAASLAGLCRSSVMMAVASIRAEEELQRRWGIHGAQTLYQPRAARLLLSATSSNAPPEEDADEGAGWGESDEDGASDGEGATALSTVRSRGGHAFDAGGPPAVRVQLMLGRQRFTILVTDEQAKVNLNRLYHAKGLAEADRAVRSLGGSGGDRPIPQLAPATGRGERTGGQPPFVSFVQVFRDPSPRSLSGFAGPPAAAQLTCWGNGRLHFRRASRAALEQVLRGSIGSTDIQKLLDLRAERRSLRSAVSQLSSLSTAEALKVYELLTDASSCQSVWVVVESGGRTWYHLGIVGQRADGTSERASYTW